MGDTRSIPKPKPKDNTTLVDKGLDLTLSAGGVNFIQKHETGGQAYYRKRLTGIVYPGGASGCTWGVGFDGGYNTRKQITDAWGGVATRSELNALLACQGAKRGRAKALARRYRNAVHFTWEEAQTVFVKTTLPRFTRLTKKTFKLEKDTLHAHSNSALVSLVFNRGSSMSGYRRRHMVSIRNDLASKRYAIIPKHFRDMKVIWKGKGLDGLLGRRDDEANLFQLGLDYRKRFPP